MGVTPPEACKVAVTLEALARPALRSEKDTLTVSPGSIAPLGGEKLSESSNTPAMTIPGAGARTVMLVEAALLVLIGSCEAVATLAVLVSVAAPGALPLIVMMAVLDGVSFAMPAVTSPPPTE